jgi:predicted AAA+ superfamily ATPase
MGTPSTPLPRAASAALADRLARAPVVVLTGARQTGKTTLLKDERFSAGRTSLTLDSLASLERARAAPDALFEPGRRYAVDEVQRAPELLLAVKRAVDADRRPGAFILSGSSNLLLMKQVSESLAGRTAHVVLRPMTPRERRGDATAGPWSALVDAADASAALRALPPARKFDWRSEALRGGMPPAALASDADDRALWFEGYVETFVARDLRDLAQVGDLPGFLRLIRLTALRVGGLVNFADLASDAGLPRTTVQRWIALLETSYLLTVLPPYFASKAKRLIKTPKLYGLDAGLGLHLAGVDTAAELDRGPQKGAWLEQLVLNDLLAWRELEVRKPNVFFYRTSDGAEIDFVIERGRRLLPIEVKATKTPRVDDAKHVESFCAESGAQSPFGLLLYDGTESYRLTDRVLAVPLGAAL